jgi:hypothetical protein
MDFVNQRIRAYCDNVIPIQTDELGQTSVVPGSDGSAMSADGRVVAFPPLLDDELRLLPAVENFLIEGKPTPTWLQASLTGQKDCVILPQ